MSLVSCTRGIIRGQRLCPRVNPTARAAIKLHGLVEAHQGSIMDLARLYLLCSLMCDDSEHFDPGTYHLSVPPPPLTDMASTLLVLLLKFTALGAAAGDENSSNSGASRIWKFPRHSTHWEDLQRLMAVVDEATRDSHWRAYYRMSYSVFQNLVEELRPFIPIGTTCDYVRAPVELDKAIAMVLHRLAHGHSAVVIAEMYNTGPSTVGKYTQLVTEILANRDKLYSKYVHVPEGVSLTRIINHFKALTDLPNMCGAIDGTHIKLSQKPPRQHGPKDYWSRHDIYSILLQGVCDCDLVFWDVCCNAPGGQHDANHLAFSPLWRKLVSREALAWPKVKVGGLEIQPYLVGDASYRSAPFLLKPFVNKRGKFRDHVEFDRLLKKGHEKAQDAFAVLKTRWQILKNLNVALSNAAQVAVACCVLHNFCQLSGEPVPEECERDMYLNDNAVARVHSVPEVVEKGRVLREALFRDWLDRIAGLM